MDPKVVEISSLYRTEASLTKFLVRHPILKADEYSHYFSVLPCGATESVCLGRSGVGPPFFYMYTYFFTDLHVSLPFEKFTMGVPQVLNVAPTLVHPNTWASLQAFRLLYDVMRLHPTPSCFLSYYTFHPAKKAAWHSLAGRTGSVLCDSFVLSYKRFKERFVKVIIRPEATTCFFDSADRSRFPLYWTRQPCDFKVWPRPTEGEDELGVLSLFEALPRKLPCQGLIGAYTKAARWAVVRGMGSALALSVSRPCDSVSFVSFLTCLFFVVLQRSWFKNDRPLLVLLTSIGNGRPSARVVAT